MRSLGGLAQFETSVMRRCPRYDRCSAPNCPLDPGYHDRAHRQADEEKCGVAKTIRLRIVEEAKAEALAAVAALPYGGLTAWEYRGRMRWEQMSDEEKARVLSRANSPGFQAAVERHRATSHEETGISENPEPVAQNAGSGKETGGPEPGARPADGSREEGGAR